MQPSSNSRVFLLRQRRTVVGVASIAWLTCSTSVGCAATHARRQIRRLLGLGSWTEEDVAEPASNSSQSDAARDFDASQDEDVCEPPLAALPQQKQRGKKRQWVSDTFQSLMESVGGGGEGGSDGDEVVKAVAKASQGGDRETAQELERLLGEVSSYEGRLDNLLDFSSSIPDGEDKGT